MDPDRRLPGHRESYTGRAPLRDVTGESDVFWADTLSKSEGAISRADVLTGLQLEHQELLAFLESHARAKLRSDKLAFLETICKKARLHYLVETGVFFGAMANAPGSSRLLDQAGEDYAIIIPLLNELADPNNDRRLIESQILELHGIVLNHIHSTEGAQGAFEFSMHAHVDWDALGRRLISRRARLLRGVW